MKNNAMRESSSWDFLFHDSEVSNAQTFFTLAASSGAVSRVKKYVVGGYQKRHIPEGY